MNLTQKTADNMRPGNFDSIVIDMNGTNGTSSSDVICKKVPVCGYEIYCETRGTGPNVVLFIPGAMGTCTTDFQEQYSGFDLNTFTIVTLDCPGYGNSRPPKRNTTGNYYKRDAPVAIALMKELGYNRYAVVGFSDGGRIAILMASMATDCVTKCVAWGCNAYITPAEKEIMSRLSDVRDIDESIRIPLEKIYGDELPGLWKDLCHTWAGTDNIMREDLPNIECPVFILHGDRDPMVAKHHADYFKANIKRCRVHRFPFGGHNLQQQYPKEFNALVQEFILA